MIRALIQPSVKDTGYYITSGYHSTDHIQNFVTWIVIQIYIVPASILVYTTFIFFKIMKIELIVGIHNKTERVCFFCFYKFR